MRRRAALHHAGAVLTLCLAALLLAAAPLPAAGAPARAATGVGEDEGLSGYYSLMAPDGAELLLLGLRVHPGDRFLNEANVWYEVAAVAGFRAQMRLMHPDEWPAVPTLAATAPATPAAPPPGQPAPAAAGALKIGIYHSHSDESYTPSDGQSNISEHGGIYQVGAAFQSALARLGYTAVDDQSAHDPHDQGAYARSRRTAMNLLSTGSTVLFDVHRDTAPAEAYARTIDGQPVTQVMIVVGRDNPILQASLAFAQALKNAADQVHPHLIRGIFMGEGGYNQDLTPRALLFEVGSYTNRREDAEAGIRLLADAMPAVLGAPTAPPQAAPATPTEVRGHRLALGWVAGLAALLGAAFLVIAAGGFSQARERLRLLPREFADILPRRRNRT